MGKESRVESLYQYWRDAGYPHYDREQYNAVHELDSIIKFDTRELIDGKDILQTMHGLGFLWTFFPHWVDVKYPNQEKTIIELWNDDDKLRELCRKTIDWCDKHEDGKVSVNRIRQNSKVYLNKQTVSNFRPTAAKYIYNTYGNQGIVWDMCAGWGGRLLGFLASNCERYYGTEPSTKSYKGLVNLKEEYNKGILYKEFKDVEILNVCAEDWIPSTQVDLCFTSPPYFDTEQYAFETTQSYMRHPTKERWIDGFLGEMMTGCHVCLKPGGHMIINIANTPKQDWIEDATKHVAQVEGFELVDTLHLVLSSIAGKGIKREPIFVFQKT